MEHNDNNEEKKKPEKTGFEDTGESDTFGEVETEEKVDAIEKEKEKPDDKIDEKISDEENSDKEISDDEKEKLIKKSAADQKEEAEKLGDEADKDIDVFDDKKIDDKKKVDEKKEEEEEVDMFDTSKMESDLDNETKLKETTKGVDWKKISTSMKLPDDLKLNIKENTIGGFVSAVKESIENAKTKTAFDLESFNDDQKEVINFFLNDGKKADLLNPLKEVDDLLISAPEEKIMGYLVNAESKTEAEAQDMINEMIESDTIEAKVKQINTELHEIRDLKYKEIIKSKADISTQRQENIQAENKAMKTYVDELPDFMGVKLPDNVKNYIKKEIDTGKLARANNNAESQIVARLFSLYGSKIINDIKNGAKNASRESYNKGLETEKKKVHNIPNKKQAKTAVEQKEQNKVVDPLELFINVDEDSITTE